MIDEGAFVTIGGIPQWVEIHGADAANPVLIAPKKTLVWFEHSGHFAPFEEPTSSTP